MRLHPTAKRWLRGYEARMWRLPTEPIAEAHKDRGRLDE